MYNKIITKLKKIFCLKGIRAIKSVVIMLLVLPIAYIYNFRKPFKELWIISDRISLYDGNGLILFNYIRENHPLVEVYYVTGMKDEVIAKYGDFQGHIIDAKKYKHYLYYALATKCIGSHNNMAAPSVIISERLKKLSPVKKKYIYMGHGVNFNIQEHLVCKKLKCDLFIVSGLIEKQFINDFFGYSDAQVVVTGMPRYDLLKESYCKNEIFIMPTNRVWINSVAATKISEKEFKQTVFYKRYMSLLSNSKLIKFLKQNNTRLIFQLHPNTIYYRNCFKPDNEFITIANGSESDIQEYIKSCQCLITDYSSVAFDAAYVMKPILYYQFDYEKFEKLHYKSGWFSFTTHGYGKIFNQENRLVDEIIMIGNQQYQMAEVYKKRVNQFYLYRDDQNSKRTFEAIKNLS